MTVNDSMTVNFLDSVYLITLSLLSTGLNNANIVFIIDGTDKTRFDVIKKLVFNIALLFGRESKIAFLLYGDDVEIKYSKFKTYVGCGQLKRACNRLRYTGGIKGRKLGQALKTAAEIFPTSADKTAKKLAFIISSGQPTDSAIGVGESYKKLDVSLYSFGIAPTVNKESLIPFGGMVFVVKWFKLHSAVKSVIP